LVLSVSCDSGDYEGRTCFGEYWLKVPENNGDTKGCIAFYGATSLSTHTLQNNWMDKGISIGLCDEGIVRATEATEYGKMWMLAQLGHSGNTQNTFYQYGLLGDPGTLIWLDRPEVLQVTHPATIQPGPQAVTVWVKDQTGAPLNGALVCAWKGSETYEYGYTMVGGGTNLAVAPATPGTMLVTVTAANMLPYEGSIEVVAGDVTPPEAISDLTASLTVQGEVQLVWTEVTQDTAGNAEAMDRYDVYRHTEAYLVPGTGLSPVGTVPAGTTTYTDTSSGAGQPETNHFYCVVGADQAGNQSGPSNRVGEFDYGF
jgi:hypothetical protein